MVVVTSNRTAVLSIVGVCLSVSLMWWDETEGTAVLSVVGGPGILFAVADSLDVTGGGGSTF